jgi:hypothetical protein
MLNELQTTGKLPLKMLHRCNRDNGSRIYSLICWLKGKALSKSQPVRVIHLVMSAELFFCLVAHFTVYWHIFLELGDGKFLLWCMMIPLKSALALLHQQKVLRQNAAIMIQNLHS